jgi:hypothetical protein
MSSISAKLIRRANSIHPSQTTDESRKQEENRRLASMRRPTVQSRLSQSFLTRRHSIETTENMDCRTLVLHALKSENDRYRSPSLTMKVAEVLQQASTLYMAGNQDVAYELLSANSFQQSSSTEGDMLSAPVFFAAEKGRIQNQVRRQRCGDQMVDLQTQEAQIRSHIARVDEERIHFGDRLAFALQQREDAKTAVGQHTEEMHKLDKMKAGLKGFGNGSSGTGDITGVIPFEGLGKLLEEQNQAAQVSKFLEEDLKRKEETVLHIQNELSELHDTLRSMHSTLELVKNTIHDVQQSKMKLERNKDEIETFVMESARSLCKELDLWERKSTSTPKRPLLKRLSLRQNWSFRSEPPTST